MATATRIVRQTAKTNQSVLLVRKKAQDKLDALLASQAAYRLFEHDETHPYYVQVRNTQRFAVEFEELASLVLGVDVDGETIALELDKVIATMIVNDKDKDESIEALCMLPKASQRTIQAIKIGEKIQSVYSNAIWVWSHYDLKATKAQLEKLYEKKNIKRHLEVPYININTVCARAVKDVQKLAAMLLNLTIKGKSVRSELEAKSVTNSNHILDTLLELKEK